MIRIRAPRQQIDGEQQAHERNRRIILTVVVLVVLAVIVTAGVLIGNRGSSPTDTAASARKVSRTASRRSR